MDLCPGEAGQAGQAGDGAGRKITSASVISWSFAEGQAARVWAGDFHENKRSV